MGQSWQKKPTWAGSVATEKAQEPGHGRRAMPLLARPFCGPSAITGPGHMGPRSAITGPPLSSPSAATDPAHVGHSMPLPARPSMVRFHGGVGHVCHYWPAHPAMSALTDSAQPNPYAIADPTQGPLSAIAGLVH